MRKVKRKKVPKTNLQPQQKVETNKVPELNLQPLQKLKINTVAELRLQPLQELLNREVDVDVLIQYLDKTYHYFSQYCMKVSCQDGTSIEEDEIACQYWIERLKRMFEEMSN